MLERQHKPVPCALPDLHVNKNEEWPDTTLLASGPAAVNAKYTLGAQHHQERT